MNEIDTNSWRFLGKSPAGYEIHEIEPDIYALIPPENHKETENTARLTLEFVDEVIIGRGRSGALLVYADRMLSMDGGARRVYAKARTQTHNCVALLGGTSLTRAIGSFFLGINKPSVAMKMTASFEEALAWCREMNQKNGHAFEEAKS